MKRTLFYSLLIVFTLVFNSCIINDTKPDECTIEKTKITQITEGTSFDIVFTDIKGDRFYINRGIERGLNLDSLNANVLNKSVTLHLAKILGGLVISEHISQLEVDKKIIFTEFK